MMDGYIGMSSVFEKMNLADAATYYARQVATLAQQTKLPSKLLESCAIFVEIFKKVQIKDSAFIDNRRKGWQSKQNLSFNKQLNPQEIINQKKALQNKFKTNIFLVIFIVTR